MTTRQDIHVNQDIPTGVLELHRILTDDELEAIARLLEKGGDIQDIALLLGATYRELD